VLFAATILVAVGYTLVYAGVKGPGYQIGGKPVWRQPWLPFVAVFTGHLGAGTVTDANTSGYVGIDTSGGGSSTPTDITNNPPGQLPATQ
jgi:hypothetical protein